MKRFCFRNLVLLFIAICILSITAYAGYEDGAECWCCGHYHYDDYMCDCGACSENCTNSECYEQSHCAECGECFVNAQVFCPDCLCCSDCYLDNFYHCLYCENCISTGSDVCDNCGACEACYLEHETHCLYCGDCFMGSEDEDLCSACFICASCSSDDICEYCGLCEECAWAVDKHCEECGNCFDNVPECEEFGGHCQECCSTCENCERCLFFEDVEICEDCGFCVECCRDVANDLDCSCGDFCVLSSDFEEHTCPDCETPFCSVEQCEFCEKCLDCCASNSECSDGMCIEEIDYEEHFCTDCGACFHDTTQCDHCADEGEYRCEDCCEELMESEGTHKATPKAAWDFTETHHYHECKYCDEYEHYTSAEKHTFNSQGICTVCSYNNGSKSIITEHPKNQIGYVTDVLSEGLESPLSLMNNKVTFSIKAKYATSYQWYVRYDDGRWLTLEDENFEDEEYGSFPYIKGATTDTLTLTVPSDGCIYDTVCYRCVVTDKDGGEYVSNSARLIIKHAFSDTFAEPLTGKYLAEFTYANGLHFSIYESSGHKYPCVGDACRAYKSEEVEPHQYSSNVTVLTDKDGIKWNQYQCEICHYKYTVKQSEDKIAEEVTKEQAEIELINSIEIGGFDKPSVGKKPDYSATLSNEACRFKSYSNEFYEGGINWYDITDKKDVAVKTGTFKEGHDYRVKLHITCGAGFKFDEMVTVEIAGEEVEVTANENQLLVMVTYRYTDIEFTLEEKKASEDKESEEPLSEEEKKEQIKEGYGEEDKEADKEKPKNPFTDVSEDAYYYDSVMWAVEEGITSGTSATTFSPNANCTRAQVVTFLYRCAGQPAPKGNANPFKDVSADSYYINAVLWAVEKGITSGTSATTFSPDDNCTRAQVVTFLYRYAGQPAPKGNVNPFNDVSADSYYINAVLWAVEKGITSGTSATTFSPNANCTRAQVVTFLYRFVNK